MTTLTRIEGMSDRTLRRTAIVMSAALAVLLAVFAVVYYIGQRPDAAPSLVDRSVTTAEDAVKAAPQNVNARLTLATTYRAAGRLDDSAAQYDEVLRAVPGNTSALIGDAEVRMAQGNNDGAKTLLTKLVSASSSTEFAVADPVLEQAHYDLAKIAQTKGDLDSAIKELTTALKIDSSDADALYLLATIQIAKGNDKVAVTELRQAVAFVPMGWCEPYDTMTNAYSRLGQADSAEYSGAMLDFCKSNFKRATSRLTPLVNGPEKIDALVGLGLVAEASGDSPTAISWYQKALVADPSNSTAQAALGRVGGTPAATPSAPAKKAS